MCIIEIAVGGISGDRLIGKHAAHELRGMCGDDVLHSGGSGGNRLFGGKRKDKFWLDVTPEAQVKVMFFQIETNQFVR